MTRILIVEDNEACLAAAMTRLDREGVEYGTAKNFEEAMEALEKPFGGAFIDCFFPRANSSIITGQELVGELRGLDPQEQRIAEFIEKIGEMATMSPELARRLRAYATINLDPLRSSFYRSLEVAANRLGPDATAKAASWGLKPYDKETRDDYAALMDAMKKDKTRQPLGVLVADHAANLGIPLVLTTSGDRGDELVRPVQTYADRRSWTIVDCLQGRPDLKAEPAFWQRAYQALQRQ